MTRDSIMRKLNDLHNELAHIREFPQHYKSHLERLARRVTVIGQIRELLSVLAAI